MIHKLIHISCMLLFLLFFFQAKEKLRMNPINLIVWLEEKYIFYVFFLKKKRENIFEFFRVPPVDD